MAANHAKLDYHPDQYLNLGYNRPGFFEFRDFALENIHKFFKSRQFPQGQPLKVLDYGCGPVLAYDISAAGIPGVEIVLAEIVDDCREAIQNWLDRAPSAWNWTPYFKHVVQTLEGNDEKEAYLRKESLRQAVKAVVSCDIRQDPPIAKGFEGPYDVVMSIVCIENACKTRDEYKAAVGRLASLVKPGGHLLLYLNVRDDEGMGRYYIGDTKFTPMFLQLDVILKIMEDTGFTDITNNVFKEEDESRPNRRNVECTAFIIGMKI